MITSESGRAFIEAFEGLFLKAYDDFDDRVVKAGERVRGTLTIGYGHTTTAGPPRVYIGMEVTKQEADDMLESDLLSVELEVAHLVKVPINQCQFDALVSFQYNTGWLTHPQCSLLRALNAGNYALTEQDFALYDEAQGHVLAGLKRRRTGERLMFDGKIAEALQVAGVKSVPQEQAAPAPEPASRGEQFIKELGEIIDKYRGI